MKSKKDVFGLSNYDKNHEIYYIINNKVIENFKNEAQTTKLKSL